MSDDKTPVPKLFAAGDMRRGQSFARVGDPRGPPVRARAIDEALMGASLLPR